MNGKVVDIQRTSTQDGPGIRTTVFLKGCNLNCAWCHNPETIDARPAIGYIADRCVHCGRCAEVCPERAISPGRTDFNREVCRCCGKCVDICLENALNIVGETRTSEEVFAILLRDKRYYDNSGGGVTISGGEPLLQPLFVRDIFMRCQGVGIHTAVDTAGNVPFDSFLCVLPYCDLVLYDIKMVDEALHQKYTGVSNRRILENLASLLERGVPMEIRIPVITGVNDNMENMEKTAALLAGFDNVRKVKLLPYHSLGVGKKLFAGRANTAVFSTPSKETLALLAKAFPCKVEY